MPLPQRTPRRRGGRAAAWRGAVVAAVLLGATGCAGSAATAPGIADQTVDAPAGDPVRDPDLGRGRELYAESCAWCHGQQGQGSQFGPSLEDSGAAGADFYLSTGRMPIDDPREEPERSEPHLGDDDIDALVAYVATLGDGPAIPRVDPGEAVAGVTPYLQNCAACHSAASTGAALPNGEHSPSMVPADPTQIAEAVRIGPGAMPPFPEHALSEAELNDVVGYVVALREPMDHGGNPLGTYGPAAEGVVGWIVGLGLLLIVARLLGKRAS